jgi:hypothetical protein
MDYFESMVTLITDPCLQLENFIKNKQNMILTSFGDMRIVGASALKNMWFGLGDKKIQFIPHLIDSFMKVALIPIRKINEEMIPLFFDMMNAEYYARYVEFDELSTLESQFDELIIPNKIITTLDAHLESGLGDYEFRETFEMM